MKNCGNKIKHTCAEKNYATCIYYEGNVPVFSGLSSLVEAGGCITIEETTEDQYDILEDIKSEIDLTALGQDCITYGVTPKTVKNVLLRYEQEICDLKDRVNTLETTAICDINITNCGIDLSGINNNCSSQVTTLGELLTYLVDNI
jgi:hypothetical protein